MVKFQMIIQLDLWVKIMCSLSIYMFQFYNRNISPEQEWHIHDSSGTVPGNRPTQDIWNHSMGHATLSHAIMKPVSSSLHKQQLDRKSFSVSVSISTPAITTHKSQSICSYVRVNALRDHRLFEPEQTSTPSESNTTVFFCCLNLYNLLLFIWFRPWFHMAGTRNYRYIFSCWN